MYKKMFLAVSPTADYYLNTNARSVKSSVAYIYIYILLRGYGAKKNTNS